jgi:hypothetical protein
LLMSTLFSLRGLPTHPQNPHSWRTSFSLLVWPLLYTTILSIIHNMSTTCFGQYYFWPSSGWI